MSDDDTIPDLVQVSPSISAPEIQPVTSSIPRTNPELPESITPVPITLITGYLGAGKSTLINYVLTAHHGFRIAVIVNEYGDSVGIEKSIIHSSEVTSHFSHFCPTATGIRLWNLSVKSDFVSGLEGMLQRGRNRFDYILLETTGLANPGPIASALWTDLELESSVFLDSIITVVDAKNILLQLDRKPLEASSKANEAQQQLAFADLILLNKVDLMNVEDLTKIEECIKDVNSTAEIQRTEKCSIDLSRILNRNGFNPKDLILPRIQSYDRGGKRGSKSLDLKYHSFQVGTFSLFLEVPINIEKFERWLGEVLWGESHPTWNIFRMKGLLDVENNNKKQILQVVHDIFEITEGVDWKPDELRNSQIVVIGLNVDSEEFRTQLENAL